MIDMHIHAVHPNLPGVKPLTDLHDGPVEELVEALREEMRLSGTKVLLGMGHLRGEGDDPFGVASTLRIAELLPALRAIGIATRPGPGRTTCSGSRPNCGRARSWP